MCSIPWMLKISLHLKYEGAHLSYIYLTKRDKMKDSTQPTGSQIWQEIIDSQCFVYDDPVKLVEI